MRVFHARRRCGGAPSAVAGALHLLEEGSMRTPKLDVRRGLGVALMTLCASVPVGPSATPAYGQTPVPDPALDSVRVALQKYQDPVMAIHDGYFSTLGCVTIDRPGGQGEVPYRPGSMGVHFLNMAAVSPTPDPAKPSVLLYEPQGDKLVLVGAEWFVPLATGVKTRPVLFGHPFDGPMAGHHPLMPASMAHYDLHVWLFK